MSCLPCPSYKTLNQDLAIGPFLHIQCPKGPSQASRNASGRLLAAWNEYSKWTRKKIQCNLSKTVGGIFINDELMHPFTKSSETGLGLTSAWWYTSRYSGMIINTTPTLTSYQNVGTSSPNRPTQVQAICFYEEWPTMCHTGVVLVMPNYRHNLKI